METAHSLQLLDELNNNISPMVNIESIYFEEHDPDSAIVYRKHVYTHFPVYIKYNNNIDAPYRVNTGNDTGYSDLEKCIFVSEKTDGGEVIAKRWKNDPTLDENSILTCDSSHIKISSVVLKVVGNTKYKMLDITTYDLSDILYMYAPKQWTYNKVTELNDKVDNIQYDSAMVNSDMAFYDSTHYNPEESIGYKNDPSYLCTTATVGNIEKGTSSYEFNHMKYIDLFDKILFKSMDVELVDVSVFNANQGATYNVTDADIRDNGVVSVDASVLSLMYANVGRVYCDTRSDLETLGHWQETGDDFNSNVVEPDIEKDENGYEVFMWKHMLYDNAFDKDVKIVNGYFVYQYEKYLRYRTKTFPTYDDGKLLKDNLNQLADAATVFLNKPVSFYDSTKENMVETFTMAVKPDIATVAEADLKLYDYVKLNIPVYYGLYGVSEMTKNKIKYLTRVEDYQYTDYYGYLLNVNRIVCEFSHYQGLDFYLYVPKFISNKTRKTELAYIDNYGVWEACNDKLNQLDDDTDEYYFVYYMAGDKCSGSRNIKINIYIK